MLARASDAWSTDWSYTIFGLRSLDSAVSAYRDSKGDWPRDLPGKKWFEAVEDEDLISRFSELSNAETWTGPKDNWGNLIVYLPPAAGAAPTSRPIIRSVGGNGIDESGAGDDLTPDGTINPGSYGRPPSPNSTYALGGLTLLLPILAITWDRARSGRVRARTVFPALVWSGVVCLIMSRALWPANRGRSFIPMAAEFHWFGGFFLTIGIGCGVIWAVWKVSTVPQFMLTKSARMCTACGYDLKGLPHSRCPECGNENPRMIPPVIHTAEVRALGAEPPQSAPHQSPPA